MKRIGCRPFVALHQRVSTSRTAASATPFQLTSASPTAPVFTSASAATETPADATIAAVKQLSADVGIPANLKGILKEEDIQFLAESAYADACRPGNPRDTSVEEIVELYKSQL